ncbi:Mobile element protein [Carbonactinospora thermoautotrophica]|uniref:Mobile element protein n=1 Tax=Carbonactinospora thermoautotrophica TaxID=1469144 RepID=A0A132MT24_9ACTN|nr:Mobile element protein [Carbonactinospora thermoautotrophica]
MLAEQANEWTEARCYMSRGMLAKARIRAVIGESLAQPIAPEAIPA